MAADVTDWHPGFLAQVYEELTGSSVRLTEDPDLRAPAPAVTGVEADGARIVVAYDAVDPGSLTVESFEVRVSREELLTATEGHERTQILSY